MKKPGFLQNAKEWAGIYLVSGVFVLVYVLDKITCGKFFSWINNKLSK